MIPIAEVMRVLINQELDNRNKRNYGQRGYDPAIVPDPSQLEWRQDGLVAFKSGSAQLLGDMSKGIFNFETAELRGTLELTQYLDGLWKEKTGVNSEAQGQTDSSAAAAAEPAQQALFTDDADAEAPFEPTDEADATETLDDVEDEDAEAEDDDEVADEIDDEWEHEEDEDQDDDDHDVEDAADPDDAPDDEQSPVRIRTDRRGVQH
jgi:hypothetical protein